jgi:hypothetical protein
VADWLCEFCPFIHSSREEEEVSFADDFPRLSTQLVILDLEFSLLSFMDVRFLLQRAFTLWYLSLCLSLVAFLVLLCMMLSCLRERGHLSLMLWMLLKAMTEELHLSEGCVCMDRDKGLECVWKCHPGGAIVWRLS